MVSVLGAFKLDHCAMRSHCAATYNFLLKLASDAKNCFSHFRYTPIARSRAINQRFREIFSESLVAYCVTFALSKQDF